ncbi:MAG: site-specific DNA-methyltransferase [Nitrospirae bacterium]|nr:site-specific DNA-methyltransferase [Nitrospirota bacterium]
MAKRTKKSAGKTSQKPIEQYEHKDKQRLNNPPVGLVDAHTDNGGLKKKKYAYDPHLDPQLQWAGRTEHTSFEVPTVSLHVHERIDPRRIMESVRKEHENGQPSLFEIKKPLREAIIKLGNDLAHKLYWDYFPAERIDNIWKDTQSGGFNDPKVYVVQTTTKVIQRCLLMTTDPGDLVLDITCDSGTTAYVAENWGRRWITCDTSRVAIALAKQRLMTANFDYYELAHPHEGVGSGFRYKTVPHVTLKSIANNEPAPQETLYDQPFMDGKRQRVTRPFTVEAVPAPVAKSLEDFESNATIEADTSVARSGETLRQSEWKDELLRTGVRAKGGKLIEFTRVETLSGTRYLQAEAETKEDKSKRVLVCFGPEHAPLEQRTVELALEEAAHLKPKPEMVLFCAFQFDEEAAKDIDETNWPGVTLLKAQMNADLLTDDLKKKRSSNESFWLIGQPDVILRPVIASGAKQSKKDSSAKPQNDKQYQVEVQGFDYYNPKTGTVESGGKSDIAMWMLDSDYDGRSLFPSQVFSPMAGAKEGWVTLAKNLKAEIDEEKIQAFDGTTSLPFTPGKAVAVKIIDARGIESLKIIRL